jgi:long-chain acyl-CoA synthetase
MYNLGDILYNGGDKIAVIHELKYTYADIQKLTNRFANGLLQYGIKKGDRVSIVAENSVKYFSVYMAILKIGAVAILVNNKLPDELKLYIKTDSKSKLELNSENFDDYISDSDWSVTPVNMKKDDPAVILYTSGSTGRPKGVVISHSHLWIIKGKSKYFANLKYFIAAPFYHMNGLSNIETALCGGSTVILMSKFEANKAIELICTHKVNYISSVPSMISLIIKHLKNEDLSCVKHVNMASAPVSEKLYNQAKEVFPRATISISYGSTEAGPGLFGRHTYLPTPEMSVGFPIPGIEYRLVDEMLQIKSPAMMLGYSNNPNKFTEDGYLITNDLFRIDKDGFYYFVGRSDDMFVCGGDNVYPRNIEVILENHPSVLEASVIGIEDEIKGMKPYAFVVLDNMIDINDLLIECEKTLPPNIRPRKIWIVEDIPYNNFHKPDKIKLKILAKDKLENEIEK